jgi:hypothetical protein
LLIASWVREDDAVPISKHDAIVVVGAEEPSIWFVAADPGIMGDHYGHGMRKLARLGSSSACAKFPGELPAKRFETIVAAGKIPDLTHMPAKKIVVLSPNEQPSEIVGKLPVHAQIILIVGEFDSMGNLYKNNDSQLRHATLITVPGAGRYLPNWPQVLHEVSNQPIAGGPGQPISQNDLAAGRQL